MVESYENSIYICTLLQDLAFQYTRDFGLLFSWCNSPQWARAPSLSRLYDHARRRTTVGRTPLDEWSAWHRDLCLVAYETHKRQLFILLAGFKPEITAREEPDNHALGSVANWDRQTSPMGTSSLDLFSIYPVQKNKLFQNWCCNVRQVQQLDVRMYRTYKVIYIYSSQLIIILLSLSLLFISCEKYSTFW